jgi:hypothetical protein
MNLAMFIEILNLNILFDIDGYLKNTNYGLVKELNQNKKLTHQ